VADSGDKGYPGYRVTRVIWVITVLGLLPLSGFWLLRFSGSLGLLGLLGWLRLFSSLWLSGLCGIGVCDMLVLYVMCRECEAHGWVVVVALGLGLIGRLGLSGLLG
jgi:hypothetical protein